MMTREVVTVPPDCPLDDAIRLFESCRFRHLPVTEKDRLVGLISDRDIALATGWILSNYRNAHESSGPKTVGEIMRVEVLTLGVDASIHEVAAVVLDHRIGAVPLLDGDKLVGIITTTDLLRASRTEPGQSDWHIRPEVRVRESMSTTLSIVEPDQTMEEAIDLCRNGSVRHLPVVEAGRLVGIISDRDLRFGLGQEIVSDLVAQEEGRLEVPRTPLSALMATDLVTIEPQAPLTAAADLMLKHGFSALPVLDGGRLIGIITQTDVLRSCC